jgi:hypothetical protein
LAFIPAISVSKYVRGLFVTFSSLSRRMPEETGEFLFIHYYGFITLLYGTRWYCVANQSTIETDRRNRIFQDNQALESGVDANVSEIFTSSVITQHSDDTDTQVFRNIRLVVLQSEYQGIFSPPHSGLHDQHSYVWTGHINAKA